MKLNYLGTKYIAKLDPKATEKRYRLYQTNPCYSVQYGYWKEHTHLIGKYDDLKSCLLYIANRE